MKKLFALSLALILVVGLMAGCGQQASEEPQGTEEPQEAGEAYQDGTYVVIADDINLMGHGNYPFIKLVIKDGKIAEVDYREYIINLGESKNNSNYRYPESPEAMENLEQQLLEKQDPDALDLNATSGATHTKEHFVEFAKEALEKAKKGEAHTPIYKDGVYEAKASEPSHGWLAQIKVFVEDGLIVGADYDEVAVEDTEGKKVVFDEDGKPVTGDDGKFKTEPVQIKAGDEKSRDNYQYLESIDAMENFEKQLVLTQDPDKLDFDATSGATHTKEHFVELAKEALKDAK